MRLIYNIYRVCACACLCVCVVVLRSKYNRVRVRCNYYNYLISQINITLYRAHARMCACCVGAIIT